MSLRFKFIEAMRARVALISLRFHFFERADKVLSKIESHTRKRIVSKFIKRQRISPKDIPLILDVAAVSLFDEEPDQDSIIEAMLLIAKQSDSKEIINRVVKNLKHAEPNKALKAYKQLFTDIVLENMPLFLLEDSAKKKALTLTSDVKSKMLYTVEALFVHSASIMASAKSQRDPVSLQAEAVLALLYDFLCHGDEGLKSDRAVTLSAATKRIVSETYLAGPNKDYANIIYALMNEYRDYQGVVDLLLAGYGSKETGQSNQTRGYRILNYLVNERSKPAQIAIKRFREVAPDMYTNMMRAMGRDFRPRQ